MKLFRPFLVRLAILRKIWRNPQNPSVAQQLQVSLVSHWRLAQKQNIRIFDDIKQAGFRCYSQYEEDGIILYILTMIGIKNKTVVEICCGSGDECMASNLIINHGFKGYLFDGSKTNVQAAKRFFNAKKECKLVKPEITHAWITKDNINSLLSGCGIEGEVDLLSLDIDGNDYYIWEAISVIQPRMCVFETNNAIPVNLSLTMPYADDFSVMDKNGAERYFVSVSLAAMDKLSTSKGYTLVGSHKHGFNVFYVRNDLLNDFLPRPSLEEIHDDEWSRHAQTRLWPLVKGFPWIEV